MAIFWLYLIGICLTQQGLEASINFERVDYVTDPAIMRINFSIRNMTGVLALSLDLQLLKEIDGQLMIKFSIFRNTGEKLNQIFSLPKTNYCTLLRNSNNIPFIRDFFNQVSKFGNIPLSCPIRRNNYYLDHFTLAGMSALPAGFDEGNYQVHFKLIDENNKGPRLIVRLKGFVRID